MKKYVTTLACLILAAGTRAATAQLPQPFKATGSIADTEHGPVLRVRVSVPEHHYLYKKYLAVNIAVPGARLVPVSIPDAVKKRDEILQETVEIYPGDVTMDYRIEGDADYPVSVDVTFQGCAESPNLICYPRKTETISISSSGIAVEPTGAKDSRAAPTPPRVNWETLLRDYAVTEPAAGYMAPGDFIAYLKKTRAGGGEEASGPGNMFSGKGMLLSLILIVAFGAGLNLTPCVLPMIPINLSIIGAGVRNLQSGPGQGSGSFRARGFALGAAYGAGIALTYGALGVAAVLAGTRFGTLNSSPVFNLAVALIFLAMSLAMFGVFNIDLTKFQGATGKKIATRSAFTTAFVMGAIAALLSGACVAPVLISVLLLSADLYSRGRQAGLLLPFLLGLGMALPWPFAAAGLSFLPRAGRWMEKIKYAFGAVILIAAAYYGYVGVSLLRENPEQDSANHAGWHQSLEEGLAAGLDQDKPVFIDFWAKWCKACATMEHTTFRNTDVRRELENFVKIRFDATDQNDPEIKAVMDRFVRVGLPTYVVLTPIDKENGEPAN